MAGYFFHLRDGSDELLDPEGLVLPDTQAAKAKALWAARDTLSHDMRGGTLDLRFHIEVEDIEQAVIYCLPFEEAFQVIRS
jgi:hypothetical protein